MKLLMQTGGWKGTVGCTSTASVTSYAQPANLPGNILIFLHELRFRKGIGTPDSLLEKIKTQTETLEILYK